MSSLKLSQTTVVDPSDYGNGSIFAVCGEDAQHLGTEPHSNFRWRMGIRQNRRWLRHVLRDRRRIMGLRLTTTWRCNSRCITCSIWQMDASESAELQIDEYDLFSRSKYFRDVEYITLSGGEPILRDDLSQIVAMLHRNIPSAGFSITTNGLNPERVERTFRTILKENPNVRFDLVGLSLNGPPEIHDATRGVNGSFEKVVETYDRINRLVPCMFSFTFCQENVNYFDWVREFAEKKGTSVYICWTVMNERFKIQDRDLVFWQPGMDNILRRFVELKINMSHQPRAIVKNLIRPGGLAFACLYDNILNKRKMPCYAARQIVHVDPTGNVFPCNFKLSPDRIIGNVKEKSFDAIWENTPARILREIDRAECMYTNGLCGDSEIYPSLSNNPPFIMKWYIRKILRRENLVEKSLSGRKGRHEGS